MTTTTQPDATTTTGALQAHANADSWWRYAAESALEWLAASGYEFTPDDLRDLGVTEPDHPARWGGLFAWAFLTGLIEPVGFTISRRKERAGGVHRIWRGTEAAR